MDRRFLHENLYQDLSEVADRPIVILGCGALGANLALSLARRGFKNFLLVDYDKIEEHNISTQPWRKRDMGKLKARVLAEMLYEAVEANATIYTEKVTSVTQLMSRITNTALLIDCFDNHDARQLAQDLNRRYNCPVLHAGMSAANTAELTWAEHYVVPQDVALRDPCATPLARTLIELTVTATAEVVIDFLLRGARQNYRLYGRTPAIYVPAKDMPYTH